MHNLSSDPLMIFFYFNDNFDKISMIVLPLFLLLSKLCLLAGFDYWEAEFDYIKLCHWDFCFPKVSLRPTVFLLYF